MTQGREQAEEWVTWYSISYSTDAFKWHFASDASGNRKVFRGNVDASTVRYNLLEQPLETRFIRLHVIEWKDRPSLRLELVGCQGNHRHVFRSKSLWSLVTLFYISFIGYCFWIYLSVLDRFHGNKRS